jgi:uncharacterized membrane protein YdjX (TVP38/TMEM64 family)
MGKARWFRWLAIVALAGAVLVALLIPSVRETLADVSWWLNQRLTNFLEWVQGLGPLGPVALGLAYIIACVAFVPGSLLTLGAGLVFGVGVGFVVVFVGANLGAAAAFLLGRTLARGWVEKKVVADPRFRAIDQAVAAQGFKLVLLLRLSPVVPFNFLNYALGLTRVSFRDYVLATLIGMVPGILLYVYLGSLVTSVADLATARSEQTVGRRVLFYVGLIATVAVTVLVTRMARQALTKVVPTVAAPPAQTQEDNHG